MAASRCYNTGPSTPTTTGTPFSVSLLSTDNFDVPTAVSQDTVVALTVFTGTGTLSGHTSGKILSGHSTATITGVKYSAVETAVEFKADSSSGDSLTGFLNGLTTDFVQGPFASSPTPVTVVNSAGFYLAITTPTFGTFSANPMPIAFCDAAGNELTVTGSTKGVFDSSPVPVVLCSMNGFPITPNITIASNAQTIVVTSTKTGIKLGRPVPVVLTDANGLSISTGTLTIGTTEAGSPLPVVFCGVTGKPITATLS